MALAGPPRVSTASGALPAAGRHGDPGRALARAGTEAASAEDVFVLEGRTGMGGWGGVLTIAMSELSLFTAEPTPTPAAPAARASGAVR